MTIEVKTTPPPHHKPIEHHVYHVHLNGGVVASVYGNMAAIAAEAICKYLESEKQTITVHDVFARFKKEEQA